MEQIEGVMADVRSFFKSRVILSAVELDLFTYLRGKPSTASELASELGLDRRAATRALDCLVTWGLLAKTGAEGPYSVTPTGERLAADHPETVAPVVLHYIRLWETWSSMTEVIRRGPIPETRPVVQASEKGREAFIGAMHVIGKGLSVEVAKDCDLRRFNRLLDIGGGSGTYTIAFLRENPNMTAVLFDLEEVIPLARKRFTEEGLMERIAFAAGDFERDELPSGCDVALLSAIIHQNSPEENRELYAKAYRALEPGGALIIRDHIMDEARTSPPDGALFALNMLVNTKGGDTYTFDETRELLEAVGFTEIQLIRRGERMDCLVEARKPGGKR